MGGAGSGEAAAQLLPLAPLRYHWEGTRNLCRAVLLPELSGVSVADVSFTSGPGAVPFTRLRTPESREFLSYHEPLIRAGKTYVALLICSAGMAHRASYGEPIEY